MINVNREMVEIGDASGDTLTKEAACAFLAVLDLCYRHTKSAEVAEVIASEIIDLALSNFEKKFGVELFRDEDDEDDDDDPETEYPEIFMDGQHLKDFLKEGGMLF